MNQPTNTSDYKFVTTAAGGRLDQGGVLKSGQAQKDAFAKDFNSRDMLNYKWVFAPYDLVETATEYHFLIDLAGCVDHRVYLKKGFMHVQAFKSHELYLDEDTVVFSQQSLGKVHRKMRLPPNVMWTGVG